MATKIIHHRQAKTLYAVAWVHDESAEDDLDYDSDAYWEAEIEAERYEPEDWPEYARKMWPEGPGEHEHWPNGYKPFFWPSDKRLYTTRKAAEARRDLINRWGGNATVVVAEVNWVPLDEMDAKWKRERLEAQRSKIEAELAELDSKCCAESE